MYRMDNVKKKVIRSIYEGIVQEVLKKIWFLSFTVSQFPLAWIMVHPMSPFSGSDWPHSLELPHISD